MKRLTRLIGMTFVTAMTFLALQAKDAHLFATTSCSCGGNTYGYQYSGSTYVGYTNWGTSGQFSPADWYCAASICQPQAWADGSAFCANNGLRGGVGYVVLDWFWVQNSSNSLLQQYDCDAYEVNH